MNNRTHIKTRNSAKEKFLKKNFKINMLQIKKYCKVRDRFHYTGEYRGAAQTLCNLTYSIPKEIPIVFHNEPQYDNPFIIKELAEEIEKQVNCLLNYC